MALPQDGQNANALATVKEVPTGKKLIFVDPTTNEGGNITLEDLTIQILKKLTSQTFALDQGNMTLLAALNQLNSNAKIIISKANVVNLKELLVNSDFGMNVFVLFHLSGSGYIGNDLPSNEKYKYGSGIIFYRNSSSCKIILIPEDEKPVWKMSTWEEWKDFENNIVK